MKKNLITALILFTCNLCYGQLGASRSEVKAKYNSKPILTGYSSDGYYFMAFKDNDTFNSYYYFDKNKDFCFMKKLDPIDQKYLQDMTDFLNTKFAKESDYKWYQNQGQLRVVIKKILYEDGTGYYFEYRIEKR